MGALSQWSQEMAFLKIWTTEWNIKSGTFLFLKLLLVIAYETLIKLHLCSVREILWLAKTVVEVNNSLCKGNTHYTFRRKRIIKEQTLLFTSQLISISCGKWPSILIFSGFLSGAVEKKEYRFCWHSGRNLQWNKHTHTREQIFNKSGINYVAGLSVLKFTERHCWQLEWPGGPYQKA